MSEMIIPTLAARKAARKKSQLTEGDAAMTPETTAPAMPASFVEPTAPAPEAAHAAPTVTATAPTASTTGVAEVTDQPSAPVVNSAPTAAFTAPVTGPARKEISVQSLLPTTSEIAKSVEKTKTAPALSPTPSSSTTLSKEMLAKLASEMGFELAKPKREFTKHTYSITPWHKDTMKQFTDVLGFAMQDAVCEAFDLFFAKHQAEFDAVRKAKGKV
jgi:hypothetical protein